MYMYGISGGYSTLSKTKKKIFSLVLVPRFYYQCLNDQETIPDQKAIK